jgi:DNA replication protein DnaC
LEEKSMDERSINQQSVDSPSVTDNVLTRSDDEMLAGFAAKISEEREHWQAILNSSDQQNPAHRIAAVELDRLDRDSPERRLSSRKRRQAEERQHIAAQAEYERTADVRRRCSIWDSYVRARGERYKDCRLDNFEVTCERQTSAVEALRSYAENMQTHIESGRNLVMFGPSGTGKDHLITAMVHRAISTLPKPEERRFDIRWTDGPSLFAKVRAEIAATEDRRDIVSELAHCWLLVLSDLLPPSAKLTDFQSDVIYRIVETRYSRMRPTWLSVNVRNRAELDSGLGVAVGDRLIDGALTIACEWPSYRKAGR